MLPSDALSTEALMRTLASEPTLVLAVQCSMFPLLTLLDTIAKPRLLPARCQSYEECPQRVVEFPMFREDGELVIYGRQLLDDRYKGW